MATAMDIISEDISALLKQLHWNEKIAFLYKKEIMADCFFVIGEGEAKTRIPAHKFILSACSQEFLNYFFLMESDSNEIFLHDFSIEILEKFLTFVYKNACSLVMDDIWEMWKISRLYGVHTLIDKCADFIGENITEENVFLVFDKANALGVPTVDVMCLNFIKKMTVQIYQNPQFMQVELETIKKILLCESLPGKEIDIYRAVNSWVENNLNLRNLPITSVNKRNLLGASLKNIRFGSMTHTEFDECTDDDNSLLSKDEMLEIFKCITAKGKRQCSFPFKRRNSYVVPKMCKRITETLTNTCCVGTHNLVQFSTNKDILMCGFGLFGRAPYDNDQELDISFKDEEVTCTIEDDGGNIIASKSVNIVHDGTDKIYEVFFKEEILLNKDKEYDLYVNRESPCGMFWGNKATELVHQDEVEFKFPSLIPYYEDKTTAGIIFKNTISE